MDDRADDIRRRMQLIRRDVRSDVNQIVDTAQELVDWRAFVRRNPWTCVGGAFVLGVMISPRPRQLLQQLDRGRVTSLMGQAGRAAIAAPGGLTMKALAVVGPMAARAAASYLLQRLGGAPPQADDEDTSRFEQVGKPR